MPWTPTQHIRSSQRVIKDPILEMGANDLRTLSPRSPPRSQLWSPKATHRSGGIVALGSCAGEGRVSALASVAGNTGYSASESRAAQRKPVGRAPEIRNTRLGFPTEKLWSGLELSSPITSENNDGTHMERYSSRIPCRCKIHCSKYFS